MNIGFIGLGNMGGPMAANLVRAGYVVRGFDVSSDAMERLAALGGEAVNSIAQAAEDADVVITMLPSNALVTSAYMETDGILSVLKPGAVCIDCSTVSPEVPRTLGAHAETAGAGFLDAPVSGGTSGAQQGTLTFMVGGRADVLEQARDVLQTMGKRVFHAGEQGAGQTVKLCNNLLLGILTIGTSEALRLGVQNGMDPKVLTDIMCQSSGQNCVLQTYNPCPGVMEGVPSARGYQGGFMTDLMLKDLSLAHDLARDSDVDIPVGELVRRLYGIHQTHGNGRLDHSSVFQLSVPSDVVLAAEEKG